MKGKDFWRLSFLILAIVSLLVEIRRGNEDDPKARFYAECPQVDPKMRIHNEAPRSFDEEKPRPKETIVPKSR